MEVVKKESWREIREDWREKIPVFREFKPLSLAIVDEMKEKGLLRGTAHQKALFRHTRSISYLESLSKGGSRFHLDGSIASQIKIKHKENASKILSGELPRFGSACVGNINVIKKLEKVQMQTRNIKATLVVTDFQEHVHIKSEGVPRIQVLLKTPSGSVCAELNSKSFRKAQKTFIELNGEAVVLVSGELNIGEGKIEGAGISVQAKKKVEDAESSA